MNILYLLSTMISYLSCPVNHSIGNNPCLPESSAQSQAREDVSARDHTWYFILSSPLTCYCTEKKQPVSPESPHLEKGTRWQKLLGHRWQLGLVQPCIQIFEAENTFLERRVLLANLEVGLERGNMMGGTSF